MITLEVLYQKIFYPLLWKQQNQVLIWEVKYTLELNTLFQFKNYTDNPEYYQHESHSYFEN